MTILSAQSIRERCQGYARVGLLDNPGGQRQALRLDRYGDQLSHYGMKIEPFEETKQTLGMSYGLSAAGYDIRVGKIDRQEWVKNDEYVKTEKEASVQSYLVKPMDFVLLSSLEYLEIPHDVQVFVHDKSTLARKGLALQNTVLEPGWRGYITLELSNHGPESVRIRVGQPIGQLVFHLLDVPTELPYVGKYQDQPDRPVHSIRAEDAPPAPQDDSGQVEQ